MASIVNNKQEFKVILMDEIDLIVCGLGDICDHCGEIIHKNYYYVAMLNELLCEKCYNRWIANAKRHKSDIGFETVHFNHIMNMLL